MEVIEVTLKSKTKSQFSLLIGKRVKLPNNEVGLVLYSERSSYSNFRILAVDLGHTIRYCYEHVVKEVNGSN